MNRDDHENSLITDPADPSPPEALEAIEAIETPVATTTDVSIILGCTIPTARHLLDTLAEKGTVDSRAVGAETIWWHVDQHQTDTTAVDMAPVDGPETDAVSLIEASDDESLD